MKLLESYDWVVFGRSPGALLSGALVARMGLSVLIVPLGESAEAHTTPSGLFFDPERNSLLGLGQVGNLRGILHLALCRAGATQRELDLIDLQNSGTQVLTPEVRVSLCDHELFQFEMERELGGEIEKRLGLVSALGKIEKEVLNYWEKFDNRFDLASSKRSKKFSGPSIRSELTSLFSQTFSRADENLKGWSGLSGEVIPPKVLKSLPGVEELVAGIMSGTVLLGNPNPTPFEFLHSLCLMRSSAAFHGGLSGLRKLLLALAVRSGAHYLPDAECKRIFVEKGRLSGLQIANLSQMVSAKAGCLGTSFSTAAKRMVFSHSRKTRAFRVKREPVGWQFTIALKVREEAIPQGLSRRAVWQESQAPLLEIEVVHPQVYSLALSQYRIVFLRTILPYDPETLELAYQRVVAARMIELAGEVMPFLEYHLTMTYPEIHSSLRAPGASAHPRVGSGGASGSDLEVEYGFKTLSDIYDNLLVYQYEHLDRILSEGGRPRFDPMADAQTEVSHLFVCSEQTSPELGNMGPVIAGIQCAAWVAHRSGIGSPFATPATV